MLPPCKRIDSPAIYGDQVETSKPYHLSYIDHIPYLRYIIQPFGEIVNE